MTDKQNDVLRTPIDIDEINKKRKEGWIEAWFSIEALAVEKELVEDSLKNHIDNLSGFQDVFVYETSFLDTRLVKNPVKDIEEAHSKIAEVKFFAKDMTTLLNVSVVFGPSAVEVIGPKKKEVDISEMQNICNALAALVHQFAAAGVGGIVITPEKKKHAPQ